jgi:GNAT superfamily N-acetyltransferase
VVERDGRVIGFAATGPARDDDAVTGSGEVMAIYLDPGAWSTGVGRRLFAAAVDDLQRRGFGPLVLWVLTANARGRRFYGAAGWRSDGTNRMLDFDGTPIEEIRYVLDAGG